MAYWILKTEPETYSFDELKKDGRTAWSGVRNYQARNFLNQVRLGDALFIYHSGKERAIVGLGKVLREAYPDPDPKRAGDWVQIDIGFDPLLNKKFKNPVSLATLKKDAQNGPADKEDKVLSDLLLIKHSRLSVIPVQAKQWNRILELS
jgi:predicted RNA-binding protein with PUA-like domain